MADANIKKTRILKSSLPPIDYDTLKYNTRYRVISEDRNRTSHWSPIYNSNGIDVVGTTGTSAADKKVKVSFKVTDIFGNAVKTFGETPTVDVMVSGVGSIDGLGSQGTLKTGTDGTAQFYAASSAAGSMQITLDGTGGQFAGVASTTLGTSAAADKKTVTITWSAAPAPEVVYAAPTLTVTKSGTKIILDGTAVEGEGDIIVYIKRVGTTKWVEQAATIEVAAPGDYNGMRIAPKSNVLIRVKQEGTGKFSNQVVVLK